MSVIAVPAKLAEMTAAVVVAKKAAAVKAEAEAEVAMTKAQAAVKVEVGIRIPKTYPD